MERETCIDSLKGIACVIVFINHFYLTFGSICYGINELVRVEPFNIVTNSNYAVCTFLIISAYLVSGQIYKSYEIEQLKKIIFKRYFRSVCPVFFASIFPYLLV